MEFVLYCLDRPDAAALRTQRRVPHLAYASSRQPVFRFGGPLLDADGRPCGSLMILELPDRAALEAHLQGDPFFEEGLFASATVWSTRQVMPERVPGALADEVAAALRTAAGLEARSTATSGSTATATASAARVPHVLSGADCAP